MKTTNIENELVKSELERIATESNGLLIPAHVVEAARPPTSPLHSKFQWDDTLAAAEHRLWQARLLIRVTVSIIQPGSTHEDRVWVSLSPDRIREGGGYRSTVTVLSDESLRAQLLEDALSELNYFHAKYGRLTELGNLFHEAQKVHIQHGKRKRKAA